VSRLGACSIHDIGGNPARHFSLARMHVWSSAPELTPADSVRVASYGHAPNWCGHTFQECLCHPVDAYLSIHSLYYLTRDDVVTAVYGSKNRVLLAVVHRFTQPYGSFADGEAQYRVDHTMRVDMTTNGNLTGYSHSALAWLDSGYYESSGRAVSWSIAQTFPHSSLIAFTAAPCGLSPSISRFTGFQSCLRATTYYGPVQLSGDVFASRSGAAQTLLQDVPINIDTFVSWGPFCLAVSNDSTTNYIVPKALVSELACLVVGRDRTPVEFQRLVSSARSKIVAYDLPPEVVAPSIIICASLAFVANVDLEVACISTHIVPRSGNASAFVGWLGLGFGSSFTTLSRALDFSTPHRVSRTTVAGISIVLAVVCGRLAARTDVRSTPSTWMGLGCAVLAAVGAGVAYNFRSSLPPASGMLRSTLADLRTTKQSFRLKNETVAEVEAIILDPLEIDNPVLKAMAPGANVSTSNDARLGYKGRLTSAPFITGVGIHLPNAVPVVHAASQQNELAAVRNRAVCARDPLNDAAQSAYFHWLGVHLPEIVPHWLSDRIVPDYHAWNRRFPPARRIAHDKALLEVVQTHPDDPFITRLKVFVKVEKLVHSSDVEVKQGDPRLIQGRQDQFNVIVGPWMWSAQKVLGEHFDASHPLFMTSGATAEVIGAWFDVVGHNDPAYRYNDDDFNRFDASIRGVVYQSRILVYQRLRCPELVLYLYEASRRRRGNTPHGVSYTVVETVASGDPDTSVGNSLCHGLVKLHLYHTLNCPSGEVFRPNTVLSTCRRLGLRLAVASDDGVDICLRNCLQPPPSAYQGLGLSIESNIRVNSYDLEFCSGRFWPTADGSVYAIKPGRLLSKLGYYINIHPKHLGATHRATLLQVRKDCAFIPIVTACVDRQMSIIEVGQGRPLGEGFKDFYSIRSRTSHRPVPETWQMLSHLYDWTERTQAAFVDLLSRVDHLPAFLQFGPLDRVLARDVDLPGVAGVAGSVTVQLTSLINSLVEKDSLLRMLYDSLTAKLKYSALSPMHNLPVADYTPGGAALYLLGYVIINSAAEEIFKRWTIRGFPMGLTCLIAFEDALKVLNLGPVQGTYGSIFSTLMHVYTYTMPFGQATLFHTAWNMFFYACHAGSP